MTLILNKQPDPQPNGRRLVRRQSSLEAGRSGNSFALFERKVKSQSDWKTEPGALTVFCVVMIFLGSMALTIYCLPPMSTVEKENEKFIWRPTSVTHFRRDKDILLRYREAHAWRLFVGMCILYIM